MAGERGRPPATRQRVLNYLAEHPGCTVAQVVRQTGAHRSHVQRILRRSQTYFFALSGPAMNSMAFDTFLVGGSTGKGTSDALEQRQAIRQMCGYIPDDQRIASYHHVSVEMVAQIRASIVAAKRKVAGKRRGENQSGECYPDSEANPFAVERRMNEMIKRGSAMLRDALLDALASRAA